MNNISLLRQTLKPHLKWHGARLSFLALFLIALFRVKTVNLSDLSTGFMGKAKTESNYKRLQRFWCRVRFRLLCFSQISNRDDVHTRTLGLEHRPNRVAVWRQSI